MVRNGEWWLIISNDRWSWMVGDGHWLGWSGAPLYSFEPDKNDDFRPECQKSWLTPQFCSHFKVMIHPSISGNSKEISKKPLVNSWMSIRNPNISQPKNLTPTRTIDSATLHRRVGCCGHIPLQVACRKVPKKSRGSQRSAKEDGSSVSITIRQ